MNRTFVLSCIAAAASVGCGGEESQPDVTAVVGAKMLDGTGAPAIDDATVLLRGERILAAGRSDSIEVPKGATVIEVDGRTLLPGLVNAHAHTSVDQARVLRTFIEGGVTTLCETGGAVETASALVEAAMANDVARAFSSYRAITTPGGYPGNRGPGITLEPTSPEEARSAIDQSIADGAHFVKFALQPIDFFDVESEDRTLPLMPPDVVQAVVQAAHEQGLFVRAHVHSPEQLEIALDAGVDGIEHILFPLPPDETIETLYDRGELSIETLLETDRLIDRMIEADIFLVPTIENETEAVPMFLHPEYTEDDLLNLQAFAYDLVGRFHERGGKVALGNDWNGFHSVQAGLPIREMEHLRFSGLSPEAIVQASTSYAATVCAQDASIGSIEPGKLADLLVVDGDVSVDLTALQNIHFVMRGGRIVVDRR